jgi:hypothetical protein
MADSDDLIFVQDPLDKRIVTLDFGGWLAETAQIASVAWVVATGITASSESNTVTTATNYFEGGTLDQDYEVSCTITTDEVVVRKKTQRFFIRIKKTISGS